MANDPVAKWPDTYRLAVDLPFKSVSYPLGFPVELATNSEPILHAACASWGRFQPAFDTPALQVRVVVEEGTPEMPAPPVFRGQPGFLAIVANPWNFAFCDFEQGSAFAFFTPEVASDVVYLCYFFLEAIAFSILTYRYLAPVHAAVVARNTRGLLLCGDSGAGKSSLSYACARAGWTLVSDNAAYLLRGAPVHKVLGDPHLVRLREDAPRLFPELNGRGPTRQINGKLAIVLQTAGLATASECRAGHLVFLDRRADGPVICTPLLPDDVFGRLQNALPRYEDSVQREILATLRDLAALPAWEMRYSELGSAIGQLELLTGAS